MNIVALTLLHFKTLAIQLRRSPSYLIPTLGFPAMFFAFFGVANARTPEIANAMMFAYVAFAIVGITLFQFGVGIANERAEPWERFVRTLPAPVAVRFAGRILCALLFGAIAAALVVVTAITLTPVHLSAQAWVLLPIYAIMGGVPFVLFGIAIGYWSNARAALPIANVFYLVLSFAGGLWIPPAYLPHIVRVISPYLPTRQFFELLWGIGRSANPAHDLLPLAAYAALFGLIAAVGYRRDEKVRYR
ncbi:MAG: ABC transporter permease [Candidatus Eremiobacteraeota bacterium]|nr:ABC transporter permease [Candidatus Eremiobacteraeota bacterium]